MRGGRGPDRGGTRECEGCEESDHNSDDDGDSDPDPLSLILASHRDAVEGPDDCLKAAERDAFARAAEHAATETEMDAGVDAADAAGASDTVRAEDVWLEAFGKSRICIESMALALQCAGGALTKPVSMSLIQEDADKPVELVHWRSNVTFTTDTSQTITAGSGQRVRIDALNRAITPTHFWDPNKSRVGWGMIHPDIGMWMFKQGRSERDKISEDVIRLCKMVEQSRCSDMIPLDMSCFRCMMTSDDIRTCAFCMLTSHPACLNYVPGRLPSERCTRSHLPATFTADTMCSWCWAQCVL